MQAHHHGAHRALPAAALSNQTQSLSSADGKYNRAQLIRLDSPVKQLVLSDNMLLPHHLVQRGWPEPGGQRSLLLHRIASHIVK